MRKDNCRLGYVLTVLNYFDTFWQRKSAVKKLTALITLHYKINDTNF